MIDTNIENGQEFLMENGDTVELVSMYVCILEWMQEHILGSK